MRTASPDDVFVLELLSVELQLAGAAPVQADTLNISTTNAGKVVDQKIGGAQPQAADDLITEQIG